VTPCDPLTPFRTGIAGKLHVSLCQQALGFGGVITLDCVKDRCCRACGQGAIIHGARQDPFGRVGLARECLCGRERGQIFNPAFGPHPNQLIGLRQIDPGGEPCRDLFGRNFGAIGMGEIFRARHLGKHPIGALGKQFFNHAPFLGINRGEQLTVMRALFGPKHHCKRVFAARLIVQMRHQAARLRLCGDRPDKAGGQPRQRNRGKCGARAHYSEADHSIHLFQNRDFNRGMSIMASSVSLTITGALPPL